MDEGKLAVLRAEVENQVAAIERIFDRVKERRKMTDTVHLESLGYQLHNLYCAFEDLFKIVARTFENEVTSMARYHTELLRRMTLDIKGVRPALFSRETGELLDNLRAFRHFFRHAYAYQLDPRKLAVVLEDALKLEDRFKKEVARFLHLVSSTV
ncbi:hypothetical protein GFC01_13480 [Desulfofundulus thermobenzoicus]|uniref:HepT-like domain-containing protein n=1 Tax=Desulfofundulus thermobenzoicus TaxID=29376 RepID=A0A6N7IT66_9FIRM|nr:hypothetical protein [Desulfofundulus thermobenzoicus]MQL53250.1 hypothetical protein [Desulfofundulus thermobenzoicus]